MVVFEELIVALAEERDREARQIALCAAASPGGGARRRLGEALIRLGVWLGGVPAGLPARSETPSIERALR